MERKPWASVPKIWYNFCTSQQLCAQRKFNIFCLQLLKTNGWEPKSHDRKWSKNIIYMIVQSVCEIWMIFMIWVTKLEALSWVTLAIVISYWPAKSGIKTTTNSHEDVAKGVKIFRISLGRHCAFRNQLKRRQSDFNHYTHFVGRLKLKCATNTNIRLYLIFVY